MSRRFWKVALISLTSVVGLVALPVAAFVTWLRIGSGCDVQGHNDSLSPDGRWQATWATEGCHGFLLAVNFDSKVTVSQTDPPSRVRPALVFESDSPDTVAFSWARKDELQIQVPSIAHISTSKREALGLSVTYTVQDGVLEDLANQERIFLGRKDSTERRSLSEQDRKTDDSITDCYLDYLKDFRFWVAGHTVSAIRNHD